MEKGTKYPADKPRPCPVCTPKLGHDVMMRVLLFLGVQPDGWVCDLCRGWFIEEGMDRGQPLAIVISGEPDDDAFIMRSTRGKGLDDIDKEIQSFIPSDEA